MEAYQRINFNQILLTLYNDSRLLFFKFLIIVCFILYAKAEFFCGSVYSAACTSQAEANPSAGIHRDAFYQVSVLYNWGFLTAGFSSYLSCYYGIRNWRSAFFSFFCFWLCSDQNLFSALAEKLFWTYWYSLSYTGICSSIRRGVWHTKVPKKFYFGLLAFTVDFFFLNFSVKETSKLGNLSGNSCDSQLGYELMSLCPLCHLYLEEKTGVWSNEGLEPLLLLHFRVENVK